MKVFLANPNAKPPTRYATGRAGYELYAIYDGEIPPREKRTIPLGIHIELEPNTVGIIETLATPSQGKIMRVSGIVDEDNREELNVSLYNFGNLPYKYQQGDRIAQLVIHEVRTDDFEVVPTLSALEGMQGEPDAESSGYEHVQGVINTKSPVSEIKTSDGSSSHTENNSDVESEDNDETNGVEDSDDSTEESDGYDSGYDSYSYDTASASESDSYDSDPYDSGIGSDSDSYDSDSHNNSESGESDAEKSGENTEQEVDTGSEKESDTNDVSENKEQLSEVEKPQEFSDITNQQEVDAVEFSSSDGELSGDYTSEDLAVTTEAEPDMSSSDESESSDGQSVSEESEPDDRGNPSDENDSETESSSDSEAESEYDSTESSSEESDNPKKYYSSDSDSEYSD